RERHRARAPDQQTHRGAPRRIHFGEERRRGRDPVHGRASGRGHLLMTSVQTAQPPQPSASRVLVVDDEESIRDLCARVLSRAGYSVSTAPNGEDAVALLTRETLPSGNAETR